MRYYISGPMTGYPNDNRPAFGKVTAMLRALGHQVVDPTELDMVYNSPGDVGHGAPSPLWRMFIVRDVAVILSSQFDVVVALDGWERSRGARMEIMAAVMCGTRVVDQYGERVYVKQIDLTDVAIEEMQNGK
jgi:hypothetical protein